MDFKIEEYHIDPIVIKKSSEQTLFVNFYSNLLYKMASCKLFDFTFEVIPVLVNMKYIFYIEIRYEIKAKNYLPKEIRKNKAYKNLIEEIR